MSAVVQSKYISVEEYLFSENDRPDGIRYEYVNGQVYAMAGASRGHNRTAGILFARLFNHLEGTNCQVFQSDMKVGIQNLNDIRFYYPDLQVTCEEENEAYFNTAPCLIIEVLSESTVRKDRTEKMMAYRLIPSLKEYVLCSQDSAHIEVYRRDKDWKQELFVNGEVLKLLSIGLEIAVDDIYSFLQ